MGIGVWQVVLVLVIVLIIFGAGKLPKVMGDVAKGVKNFKTGLKEGEEEAKADDQGAISQKEETEVPASSEKKDVS
jgi:sec-independent protein translocase protein TatA